MTQFKYPKGERGMVKYSDKEGVKFILTTKEVGGYPNFYLYEVSGETLKKLGGGRSPLELEEKFNVEKVLKHG